MALYNRVLAFQIFEAITEFTRSIIKELAQGRFGAHLRQTGHKGPKRYQQLGRPVIIPAEKAPEICGNQIVIEINKCNPLPQQEVLAALFTQMVRTIRDERQAPAPIVYSSLRSPSTHKGNTSRPTHIAQPGARATCNGETPAPNRTSGLLVGSLTIS